MKNRTMLLAVWGLLFCIYYVYAHDDHGLPATVIKDGQNRSVSGENPWNQGVAPENPWKEIKRTHGHVGPWNVLGWRVGQQALAEFQSDWGRHELDIVCYIPMQTPYSCIADGLVVGTGNSLGRLDIRLAETAAVELINVKVRRKDGSGPVIIFTPKKEYMNTIISRSINQLEALSRICMKADQKDIFNVEYIYPAN